MARQWRMRSGDAQSRKLRTPRRTWWIPDEHEPWPLRAAEILDLDDDLLDASGVTPAGPHLRALFSPGVRSRFGRPTVVR